jgi:adenylosuccinate synthase
MKVDVLLGLQWGDEGKGKVVDVLTPGYNMIARFQGGPNAGHSLEFNNSKYVLHTIPSGIFRKDKINVIGNGVVIDPSVFIEEISGLEQAGFDLTNNLLISKKAHLILPSHRLLDAAYEKAKGKSKIGSTLKGIGPAYTDKVSRNGLRIGDILLPTFKEKYDKLVARHKEILIQHQFDYAELEEMEKEWFRGVEEIRKFKLINSENYINECLIEGLKILAEGAQGTLLDIDFGSYPFVTSSNTVCAGACTGLGVAPNRIGEVYGIFKAYCTRVGSGPFPTELDDQYGDELRNKGHEFGATTGRPRRCGWLDLVALKYSVIVNGVTQLIMTKSDVLSGMDKINICTKYKTTDGEVDFLPYSVEEGIEPVYIEMEGWQEDITKINDYKDLPTQLKDYIKYIEDFVGVPVKVVSVGPDRDETIVR